MAPVIKAPSFVDLQLHETSPTPTANPTRVGSPIAEYQEEMRQTHLVDRDVGGVCPNNTRAASPERPKAHTAEEGHKMIAELNERFEQDPKSRWAREDGEDSV